jgi:DAK2 domain fusion protein YloV
MSMTVQAMSKSLSELVSPSVTKIADTMSYATLRGARGNSGVILSQFMRGISKALKGLETCDAKEFANALLVGSQAAYKAVMKPTEGTILTVAREVGERAVKTALESDDITEVLLAAVKRGNKVLAKTQEMLPALTKAGVVDAGGQGWMFFLEGVLYYLEKGNIIEATGSFETVSAPKSAQGAIDEKSIKFMYCTEFIVEKSSADANVSSFRKAIETKGDCMLVIDDDDIVKVHIHTNNPGYVLEKAVLLGSLINIKIDNMKHQHSSIINEGVASGEKKEETPKEHKDFGFVSVCAGKGISEIFKSLGVDEVIEGGQTMNPSTDDIIDAVNKINADAIFVFPNNKNIIMAANQAKEISDKNIIVIPTKTIPQCVSCMVSFSASKSAEQNEAAMNKAMGNVKTGQITFAVRDTQIDELSIKEGDILGLLEGKISTTGKSPEEVLKELAKEMCDDDTEFLTVYYGEDISKETAEELAEFLEEEYPDVEISMQNGTQPLYYYILSAE